MFSGVTMKWFNKMYLAKKIPQQKRVENTGLKVLFGNREQKNQITLQNVSFLFPFS